MKKMEKFKLWLKIYFSKSPISYGKFFEHFNPIIKKIGISKEDLCEYRLTQVFDENNQPTEDFYYSNKSLGPNTTYKSTNLKEFTDNYNLEYLTRERNNGIFNKKTKTKIFPFFGVSKLIVNTPYMIKINFGDFIAISNDLLMVIPKSMKKNLFK